MTKTGVLEIFVSAGCLGCKKAVDLAQWVTQVNPRLEVHAVDGSQESEAGAKALVAVPTYVYNGEPVFLGNPSPDELRAWLDKIDPEG